MASVGVRELKSRLSHYIDRASHGESVIVTEHGKPVAVIAPLPQGMRAMERLRRAGAVQWAGGKPLVVPLARDRPFADVSAAVVEARRA